MDLIKDTKFIYDKLGDAVSRDIFVNRLAYSLTGHLQSLRNVINTIPCGREVGEKLSQAVAEKRKICIFGVGSWGNSVLTSYADISFSCFIDNDPKKSGKAWGGGTNITF